MEAISHAGTAIGLLAKDGIVLAAEKKIVSKLLDSSDSEKTHRIDDCISCVVAGITADANSLIEYLRDSAQKHKLLYDEDIPVETLVRSVANVKQSYTQYGGMRPFGVSFLFAGWDKHHEFQLYNSDPSGNYGGWKATAIGGNSQAAQSILKTDWKEGLTLEETLEVAIRIMSKTMDSTALSSEKLEFCTISRKDNKVVHKTFTAKEIDDLIKRVDLKKDEKTE